MEKEKQGKRTRCKGEISICVSTLLDVLTTTTSLLLCFSVIVSSVRFLTMFLYSLSLTMQTFPNVFLSVAEV